MTPIQIPDDQRDVTPILTAAGKAKLVAATSTGLACRISHVAIGRGIEENGDGGPHYVGYDVEFDQAALKGERQRSHAKVQIETSDDHTRAHVTAIIGRDGEDATPYPVREVGFFLSDGAEPNENDSEADSDPILFAVWATPPGSDRLLEKSPDVDLLLAFELVIPDEYSTAVRPVSDALFDFPDATPQRSGVLRLARNDEVTAATEDTAAVTPSSLRYATSLASPGGEVDAVSVDANGSVQIGAVGNYSTPALVINRASKPAPNESGETPYVPAKTLHLKGGGPNESGARLNFGDGEYVYIDEPQDDVLRLHGNKALVLTSNGAVIKPETGTKPSGIHLDASQGVHLIAGGVTIRVDQTGVTLTGPVTIEGDLTVTQSMTSPKWRYSTSFPDRTGTTNSANPSSFTFEQNVPVGGDFLLLASFERVTVPAWYVGTMALHWDERRVAEIQVNGYFRDAGSDHLTIASPSTHALLLNVAAGHHKAKVSYWTTGGQMDIANATLSLVEL